MRQEIDFFNYENPENQFIDGTIQTNSLSPYVETTPPIIAETILPSPVENPGTTTTAQPNGKTRIFYLSKQRTPLSLPPSPNAPVATTPGATNAGQASPTATAADDDLIFGLSPTTALLIGGGAIALLIFMSNDKGK